MIEKTAAWRYAGAKEEFPVIGKHENNTLDQFRAVSDHAERGALMADGHLGYIMPIGGVAAYKDAVLPAGVGYDIGCGNLAVKLSCTVEDKRFNKELDDTLDWIQRNIPFGMGRSQEDGDFAEHALFDDLDRWHVYDDSVRSGLRTLARKQLGTVGSGNHYVDIFVDEESGNIWIGVHFGSRGLGHKTATGFMNLSITGDWEKRVPEQHVLLDLNSDLGERYFRAMELCGDYAYAGREEVARKIVNRLGATVLDSVHNHHNYAWVEEHFGENYIVVRKGATPAFPGQRGFVGGSMGDNAVIIRGKNSPAAAQMLRSTVHGAGRVMGRMQAKGKVHRKTGKVIREGKVTVQQMSDWLKKKKVKLRGGDVDESPHVYKRLDEVLEFHKDTIEIEHILRPIGVVMAGRDVIDPYKD